MKNRTFFALLAGQLLASAAGAQTVSTSRSDKPVEISPFIVTEDGRDTYEAHSTTGVTGTNRAIKSLPMSMSVATELLLRDLGATSFLDVLSVMPNVGLNQDSSGGGNGAPDNYRLRGLNSKEERRRNGLYSQASVDSFATGRIEFLRGTQALLYGQGISAGGINVVTKQATRGRTFGELTFQADDLGTHRWTFDVNLSKGPLALRMVAVESEQKYWQNQIGAETRGVYAEFAYDLTPTMTVRLNHQTTQEGSALRGGVATFRDNSLRDSRNNTPLDILVLEKRASGIVIAGQEATWKNYRSVTSGLTGRDNNSNTTNLSFEARISSDWSARISGTYENAHGYAYNATPIDLLAPGDSRADRGQWSLRSEPTRNRNIWQIRSVRTSLVYQKEYSNILKHDVIFGAEFTSALQKFNSQRLFAVDGNGRTLPGNEVLGRQQYDVQVYPIQSFYPGRQRGVPGYAWMDQRTFNATAPTPANPNGVAGSGSNIRNDRTSRAIFANWLGTWLGGRFETMAGARVDAARFEDSVFSRLEYDDKDPSGTVGAVWRINPTWSLYANHGLSFTSVGASRAAYFNFESVISEGKSTEVGVKTDLWNGRISGSLAAFDNTSRNEPLPTQNTQVEQFNPTGINGRATLGTNALNDVASRGLEVVLTFKPSKNWTIALNAATNDARTTKSAIATVLYNDQFNTNGTTVQAKNANGTSTDLLVPSVRTNPDSPRIPLTLAMMKDPRSDYFAQVDPTSGAILNANNLFLTAPGVRTGVSGLPISSHQLGFVAPNNGQVEVFAPGQYVAPNAGRSVMLNTTYAFRRGWWDGFSIGGLWVWQGDVRQSYAFIDGQRRLYFRESINRVDLRIGYHWRLGGNRKLTLQATVGNVFDRQALEPVRNVATGVVQNVNVSQPPRVFTFTGSVRF